MGLRAVSSSRCFFINISASRWIFSFQILACHLILVLKKIHFQHIETYGLTATYNMVETNIAPM
jgi:hypothetical protein